jgi:NAD(P)-dependent dehydrogenase (short-subunit alcohol dehydrogenase family)
MSLLAGKVALITGGASGLGAASAMLYAAAGAKVIVTDIDANGGNEVTAAIKDTGGDAVYLRIDVSKEDEVAQMVKFAVQIHGRIDCALNNAGIFGKPGTIGEMPFADWQEVQNVNLSSVWLCMKYEIPEMLKTGGGSIVNMASVAALIGRASMSHYVAAKHGIVGITKTAAIEYGRQGIRVNAICPGYIDTKMMNKVFKPEEKAAHAANCCPLGRHGQPAEIGELAVFLSSAKASYITGQIIAADGGLMAG